MSEWSKHQVSNGVFCQWQCAVKQQYMACTKHNLHGKQTCYVYCQSSEPITMQLTVQAVTTDRWFIYPSPKPHTFTKL
jgi:hypothetical protein